MSQKSYDKTPTLYLVPTPIGNMGDMTYRGVEILKNSEVIFSEDTRESKKLLDFYGINKKLISYHKFNEDTAYLKIISYLDQGYDVSIITDRGTPLISDPGYEAVFNIAKTNYNLVCLPGATAFTPALVNSGLNPNHFLFYGFLNSKKNLKKKELEKLKLVDYTLIFYESPFRIIETLNIIFEIMGDRTISISREISKKHEEVYRGKITEVLKELIDPKGEFVLVVDGNREQENYDDIDVVEHIDLLVKNGVSEKDAIKEVAHLHNLKKQEVYMTYIKEKSRE